MVAIFDTKKVSGGGDGGCDNQEWPYIWMVMPLSMMEKRKEAMIEWENWKN